MVINTQIIIYSYIFICISIIVFNILFIQKKKIDNIRRILKKELNFKEELSGFIENNTFDEDILKYLKKEVKTNNDLMALDSFFDSYIKNKNKNIFNFIYKLKPFYFEKFEEYLKKDEMYIAYIVSLLSKYNLVTKEDTEMISKLFDLISGKSTHVRFKVLKLFAKNGDSNSLITALKIISNKGYYYNNKIVLEILNDYKGDYDLLKKELLNNFYKFSEEIQKGIITFLTTGQCKYRKELLNMLEDDKTEKEVKLEIIKFFGRTKYTYANKVLINIVNNYNPINFEYTLEAVKALKIYDTKSSLNCLRQALSIKNELINNEIKIALGDDK